MFKVNIYFMDCQIFLPNAYFFVHAIEHDKFPIPYTLKPQEVVNPKTLISLQLWPEAQEEYSTLIFAQYNVCKREKEQYFICGSLWRKGR